MSDLTNEFVKESHVFKTIGNMENNLRLRTWQIFRHCDSRHKTLQTNTLGENFNSAKPIINLLLGFK